MKLAHAVLAAAAAVSLVQLTGCAVARDQQTVGSYIDDATITTRVKARMAEDKSVSATSISVDERELDGSSTPDRGADFGSIPGRAENEKAARRDNTAGRVRIIPR